MTSHVVEMSVFVHLLLLLVVGIWNCIYSIEYHCIVRISHCMWCGCIVVIDLLHCMKCWSYQIAE